MASNYTSNYGLCQWEPGDSFMRTEFNGDNAKVDAALRALEKGKAKQADLAALTTEVGKKADQRTVSTLQSEVDEKARMTCGTYTGTGAAERFISVGMRVRAVIVETPDGQRHQSSSYGVSGGLALTGHPLCRDNKKLVEVNGSGFSVFNQGEYVGAFNVSGATYYYLAFQ